MARTTEHFDGLSDDAERRLEGLFAGFEAAWKKGRRPRIADHLPSGPPRERRAALIEFVLIDLEYAVGRDPSARIEGYLAEFPELSGERDLVLELADREYRLRRERGESPTVKDYVARFPDLAARLVFRLEDGPMAPSGDEDDDPTGIFIPKSPTPTTEIFFQTGDDASVPAALPDVGPARYRHIRPHAKGGLGEVFIASDTVLGRKVALKRIRPQLANDPAVRRRFLREAEITARLEHPGIAPIHELITDRSGQPWYVMRFLKGHTLRSAIQKYHKPKSSADESARTLEFRGMLTRLISVCETMSYAHRLGVVHRDLTPANVMLGDYGETIVLDWGFATASGEPDPDLGGLSTAPAASPLDASMLQSGKLFGTPAFMAPEQAGMHQSAVGPASDIYCLGAILYMLLTGRPPFVGGDLPATLEKIQKGDFPRPRELAAEIPAALEAVCLAAMRLRPEDRYADAHDLGRDLERWLAGEPVSVYREPLNERLGRWTKRHRRRLVAAAAAVGIAVVGGAIYGGYSIKQRWAAQETARREADAMVVESRKIADRAGTDSATWKEAAARADEALARLDAAGVADRQRAEVRSLIADYRGQESRARADEEDAQFERDLHEARVAGSSVKDGRFDVQAKLRGYEKAFATHGIDLFRQGTDQAADQIIRRAKLRPAIVAHLDDWILDLSDAFDRRHALLAIASHADPDPLSKKFRAAVDRNDREGQIALASEMNIKAAGPTRAHTVGYALYKAGARREAASFLKRAQTTFPGDFWINTTLAQVFWDMDEPERREAIAYYQTAETAQPNSPAARLNYANALLLIKRDISTAIDHYRAALELKPDYAEADYALGTAYAKRGDAKAARDQFLRAIAHKPDFAEAHGAYVATAFDLGDLDGAAAFYRARVRDHPRSAEARCGLGMTRMLKDDLDGAVKEFRAALAIGPDCAWASYNLGRVLLAQGQVEPAIAAQRDAVKHDPSSPLYRHGLAQALCQAGKLDDAIAELNKALERKRDFPEARWDLGLCLRSLGKFPEALEELARGRQSEDQTSTIEETKEFAALREKLKPTIDGEVQVADPAENLKLARLCHCLGRYGTAVHFWEKGLANVEGLGDVNEILHDAGCDAVLAGIGRGEEKPGGEERSRLLDRGREWLGDECGLYADIMKREPNRRAEMMSFLRRCRQDPELAGVREPAEIGRLPETERRAWREFWDGLDRLIASAGE